MTSSHNVLRADDTSTTDEGTPVKNCYLPGPAVWYSLLSSHDKFIEQRYIYLTTVRY